MSTEPEQVEISEQCPVCGRTRGSREAIRQMYAELWQRLRQRFLEANKKRW